MFKFSKRQKVYLFIKRVLDIIGALIGIIILLLPMLVIALLTACTSKGPVIFSQNRYGKNGKVFKMFKFRSMKVGTKEIPPDNLTIEEQKSYTTKWGRFMRKTSIDELPQIFNILIGEMSFIGPRPGAAHNEENLHEARLKIDPSPYMVRPGLSGYAQVYFKRNHDVDKKVTFDSYYVKHISFWLDIKILFHSFFTPFNNKGK
jgi:O-antigen biosynthesis protein WbqP